MTREERRAEWQERIHQWQQSGLRLATFARQHELDIKRLAYWRTRLKSNAPPPVSAPPAILPLRIAPDSPRTSAPVATAPVTNLTITSPSGWHISLPTSLPVTWLGELLRQLP